MYDTYIFQCFTLEQVKEINRLIKKNIYEKEKSFSQAHGASKTGDFFHISISPLMELIYPWLDECQITNRNIFGYDIYWNFHLDGLTYNVYGTGGKYDWHIDGNTEGIQDMKLTCLLNLSEEPYEGGELFLINDQKNPTEFSSGMGIVFNSMLAHKVTPVTKGKRISLTYWAIGPNWK